MRWHDEHHVETVVQTGTGRNAALNGHVAGGKTGTSQGFRDALFVGHTAHLITGVWFGNDNNQPTRKITGGSLPAQAWKDFMTVALRDLPLQELPGQPYYYLDLPRTIPCPKVALHTGLAPGLARMLMVKRLQA